MAKGEKTGGRKKGTPNKQTVAVKQCILNAFEHIGGVANLAAWAEANPTDFYTKMWVKVMPAELTGTDGGDIQITINKVIRSADD
tara:strand:+ start:1903 stop:2157 length:255 start_codon:yes stop_codon:yes gene_type:complete